MDNVDQKDIHESIASTEALHDTPGTSSQNYQTVHNVQLENSYPGLIPENSSKNIWKVIEDLVCSVDEHRAHPKLVLTVIGDSTNFVPKPWNASIFKAGLIETAKGARDCVILYKGSREKVSTIVREAVDFFHALQKDNKNCVSLIGLLPENHESDYIECRKKFRKSSICLVSDILHLKLGDRDYESYLPEIVRNISNEWIPFIQLKDILQMRVPVVTIVLEGDLQTIITLSGILTQNLPIMIIKGSGKAADFVAEFIEQDILVEKKSFQTKTNKLFGIFFQKADYEQLEKHMKIIKENQNLVTVLDINKQTTVKSFTEAVVNAIIDGWAREAHMEGNSSRKNEKGDENDMNGRQGKTKGRKRRSQSIRLSQKMHPNVGRSMRKYKDTTKTTSLSLYYYIAYQFIQEMESKEDKRQNFKCLLREAIIGDQVNYVSVLLDEEGVEFDPMYFSAIYKETLYNSSESKIEFHQLRKFGPIGALRLLEQSIDDTIISSEPLTHILTKMLEKGTTTLSKTEITKHMTKVDTNYNKSSTLFLNESQEKAVMFICDVTQQLEEICKLEKTVKWLDANGKMEEDEIFTSLKVVLEKVCAIIVDLKFDVKELSASAAKLKKDVQYLESQSVNVAQTISYTARIHDITFQTMNSLFNHAAECMNKARKNLNKISNLIQNENLAKDIDSVKSTVGQNNQLKSVYAGRQIVRFLLSYPQRKNVAYKNKMNGGENEYKENRVIFDDLLIWAVLSNRTDLATLFWSKCSHQLLGALFVSCVYKKMASEVHNTQDQSNVLLWNEREQARIFAEKATDLQDSIYKHDPNVAMNAMVEDATFWDITVCPLKFAHDNEMLEIVSHTSSQKRLKQIWYNGVNAKIWKGLKIFLSYFFWSGLFLMSCAVFVCVGGRIDQTNSSTLRKLMTAPLFKFLVHSLFFLLALVWFSVFLLVEFEEWAGIASIQRYEWLLNTYLLADILEKSTIMVTYFVAYHLQGVNIINKSIIEITVFHRLKNYFCNGWNILDNFFYFVIVVSLFLRIFLDYVAAARRSYSVALFLMYMRFFRFFLMSKKIGPQLILITKTLKDFFRYIGLLFILTIGVGVLYHANMYPAYKNWWNGDDWEYWRIWKLFYIPYWQIYGNTQLYSLEAEFTGYTYYYDGNQYIATRNCIIRYPGDERCNQYDWLLIVVAAVFMLMSNLIFVNLIIALFSYRFQQDHEISMKLWRNLKYEVIMDFQTRVPVPLNLFIRPVMICIWFVRWFSKNGKDIQDKNEAEQIDILQSTLSRELK